MGSRKQGQEGRQVNLEESQASVAIWQPRKEMIPRRREDLSGVAKRSGKMKTGDHEFSNVEVTGDFDKNHLVT